MEPDFEVPELSLSGGPAASRTVRLRYEWAMREGFDTARRYRVVDAPADADAVAAGQDGMWVEDEGRPRWIPLAQIERRRLGREQGA
jgi:hypothetical protein